MTEVSVFGWLVATLASAASVASLLLALVSAAFVAVTAAAALEHRFAAQAAAELEPGPWDPLRVRRTALITGGLWALAALVFGIAGLRVGGFFLTGVVITAGSLTAFGAGVLTALLGLRAVAALVSARQRRLAASLRAEKERVRHLDESRRRYLEGADLREEVAEAEAALLRLRSALRALEDMKVELDVKLEAAEAAGHMTYEKSSPEASAAAEYARVRDEITAKLDLGERILAAAEAAVFRLACYEPLRRLLRRRPHEATSGLARARSAAELEACAGRSVAEIQSFLGELDGGRAVLNALAGRRPEATPEGASDDPLKRARAEIDAVEAAYRAVLDRAGVVRVRLAARAGMEQVTAAVGALSESARSMGVDEGELRLLLDEVARAESAMSVTAPSDGEIRVLTEALARSAAALDRNDATSLDELVKAMRELG